MSGIDERARGENRGRALAFGDVRTVDDLDFRQRRLRFRAWHRGTREADLMIGGFADRHAASWTIAEIDWFEALLEQQDVDIMAWAIGSAVPPPRFAGAQMTALQRLDYVAKAMR